MSVPSRFMLSCILTLSVSDNGSCKSDVALGYNLRNSASVARSTEFSISLAEAVFMKKSAYLVLGKSRVWSHSFAPRVSSSGSIVYEEGDFGFFVRVAVT